MTYHSNNKYNDERLDEIDFEVEMSARHSTDEDLDQKQLSFINDESKANDVMYWYEKISQEIEEINEYAKKEIERIIFFKDQKMTHLIRKQNFYKMALESYLLASGDKSKSMINGKIGFRKSPDRVSIVEEGSFLAWAKKNKLEDLLVKTEVKSKPLLKEIKKYIQETGECPDTVDYIDGVNKFYIKPEVD